jgi:glutathione S-transferase
MITLGDVIRIDYSTYPNLSRWLATMKAVPYWEEVNDAFYTYFVGAYKDMMFEGL